MSLPIAYYQEQAEFYKDRLRDIKNRYRLVGLFRLLSFVAFLIAGYQWLKLHNGVLLAVWILSIAAFIVLVRMALRLNDQKALAEKLLFINENEIRVLQDQPNGFSDGSQFATSDDYSGDLDIFGQGSLFQLLNRTTTLHGAKQLAGMLQQPLSHANPIEAQQEAVKELSGQKELRQLITAHGLLHEENEGNLYDVVSWLRLPPVLHGQNWIRVMRFVVPLISVAALIYYLISDSYFPLALVVILSWSIIGSRAKKIKDQHNLLGKKQSILEQYATILTHFSKVQTGSSQLLQQEKELAQSAYSAIKKLSSLASFFDQRLNLLVNIFLNSFFLYDIQCLWALENWKKTHTARFNEWIDCVGTIETLNSLATFAFNNPSFQYATPVGEKMMISASGLAHPLIPARERVANDFTIGKEERLALITGSNMSGKTTFLRTLGVNLLLAQCGAPVCATRLEFTPMQIRTSIRVSDSLQEHTSYFMAELKRLQQIIRHLEESKSPTLVMIDEILRGTNSEDKTHGSEQFIKKLLQYNCLTLFATHDLALSKLETELPGEVSNYCFESTIREGELLFDYTLQKGVAKNRNASFLMKKMEII
jgi:DNA mismatch repair ATPase MutS